MHVHPATLSQPNDKIGKQFSTVNELGRRAFGYTLLFSLFSALLNLAVPANMFAMYSLVIPSQDPGNAVVITGAVLVLLALLGLMLDIRSRLLIRFGLVIDSLLGDKVILGMLQDAARQDRGGFTEAMNDLRKVRDFLSSPAVFAYFDCVLVPVQLLVVYLLSPVLAMVAAIALLTIILLTWRLESLTRLPLRDANALAAQNSNFLQECLRNLEAVRAMGMTGALTKRWQKGQDDVLTLQFSASEKAGALAALSKTVTMSMPVLMLGIGAGQVISDPAINPITIIIASIMGGQMLSPLHQAVSGWRNFQETIQSFKRLKALFAGLEQATPRLELPPPEGYLNANQVSYALPNQALLQGVSFDLEAGEFLGLIGPMAAGKTTLARILTGVQRPSVGKVRLDGADIHIWDQENLGRHLGYLPQEIELFPGTVAENICRMAELDQKKLTESLRLVGLNKVIERLPAGIETVIEDRGSNLPGGLRQRIGLARALYGDPRVVILDEPDANLDESGRLDLLAALRELKQRKTTVVMVTHRFSLLKEADKILVLRDGLPQMFGPAAAVWAKLAPNAGKTTKPSLSGPPIPLSSAKQQA